METLTNPNITAVPDKRNAGMLKAVSTPATPPPKPETVRKAAKRSKQAKVSEADAEATELGLVILAAMQRVTVKFHGSTMVFNAAVERSAKALSLLVTRDGFNWEPPEDTQILVNVEDGDFECAYLGTRVTFGLQATLLGFIVLTP